MPIRRPKEIADQRRLRQMRGKKETLRLAPRGITTVTEKRVHSWQYLQFRLFLKVAIFGKIDVDRKGDFEFWRNLFEIDTFQQGMPCVLFLPSANVANDVKTAKPRNSNDSRNGGSSVTDVGVG